MSKKGNLSYVLSEGLTSPETEVTYNELVEIVNNHEIKSSDECNMEDFAALEVHYLTNYTRKEMDRIAEYYKITKRKKRKDELTQDIVLFEMDPENCETAYKRKKLWSYMKEIKKDNYLSKFLIFN
jgi:hypothetical protein